MSGVQTGPSAYIEMFDLHKQVRHANRRLDDCFPPYQAKDFEAIREGAELLRRRAEELRDHLDSMRSKGVTE